MNKRHDISRTSLVLLAAALGACNPDTQGETESASSTGGSTTEVDPSGDPTGDPGPSTEPPTSTEPSTEPPTSSTDPTTTDPTTTEPATDTATETDPGTSSTGEPVAELTAVWATANPVGLTADALIGLTPALDAETANQTLLGDVVSIQSLAYLNNDAIITYDAPGDVGGVLIIDNLPNNLMAAPIGLGSRIIAGPTTGLIAPKGVEATGPDGLILVADTGAKGIHAFQSDDEGDVAPQFTITDLGAAEGVWDVHYVGGNTDALYAAGTNGEVLVYEDFANGQGQAGPDRVIVPTQNDTKVSVNLHGITIDGTNLYLSDVGDPMDNADGQLFVLEDVGNLDGEVEVLQRIQGGDLGNPVDIELRAGLNATLYVAEKANDKLLLFRENVITNELEAAGELAVTKPESVALRTGTTLLLAQNSAGVDTDGAVLVNTPMIGDPTAGAVLNQIGSISSVQSLALSLEGRGYVGFDGPAVSGGGGVFVVDGLTGLVDAGQVDAVASRLWGPETGIVTPKGIVLTAAQDRLIVADTAAANIKVFDTANLGNVEPLFVFDDLGGAPVWDIAYDDVEDRLFAAGVDGVVRVFDGALASQGTDAPTRLIVPTDGQEQISVNLHGIHYDAASKILLLSDVGDAMDATDGAILLIADADTADDQVEVLAAIRGDATKLGNPVDIAFDGANLYVAEKSNSAVLRYDAILDYTGSANNTPEDAMTAVANAESVQLFYSLP